MLTEAGKVRYPFLEGGGEMGELSFHQFILLSL